MAVGMVAFHHELVPETSLRLGCRAGTVKYIGLATDIIEYRSLFSYKDI